MAGIELAEAPWFRLSYYAGIGAWSDEDWLAAIAGRYAIKLRLEGSEPAGSQGSGRIIPSPWLELEAAHFEMIATRPIDTSGVTWAHPGRTHPWSNTGTAPVNEAVPFRSNPFEMPASGELDDVEFWTRSLGTDARVLVVDAAAPDAAILKAFAAWLKTARMKYVHEISEENKEAWTEFRVIPYIDLALFMTATGVEINDARVAKALWSDIDDDGTIDFVSRLRKTTKKHAATLQSKVTMNRLAAQIGAAKGLRNDSSP